MRYKGSIHPFSFNLHFQFQKSYVSILKQLSNLKPLLSDLPGSLVARNPPSSVENPGSTPGWGMKIPQATKPTPELAKAHKPQQRPTQPKKKVFCLCYKESKSLLVII